MKIVLVGAFIHRSFLCWFTRVRTNIFKTQSKTFWIKIVKLVKYLIVENLNILIWNPNPTYFVSFLTGTIKYCPLAILPFQFIVGDFYIMLQKSLTATIVIESEINGFWIGLIILLGPIFLLLEMNGDEYNWTGKPIIAPARSSLGGRSSHHHDFLIL